MPRSSPSAATSARTRAQTVGPLTVVTIGALEDLAGLLLRGARS
jgi:hypothetical protein